LGQRPKVLATTEGRRRAKPVRVLKGLKGISLCTTIVDYYGVIVDSRRRAYVYTYSAVTLFDIVMLMYFCCINIVCI